MRKIYYGKRMLDEYGYIFANADTDEDPAWPIQEENIYAAGLRVSISPDDGDITKFLDFDVDNANSVDGCKAAMRGETSDWKIAAIQVSPASISIYFTNQKAYETESLSPDCDADKYAIYAELNGRKRGVSLEFKLPHQLRSSIMSCHVHIGQDFTELTEFEKDRKRLLIFNWGLDECGEECPYVFETECIY